MSLGGSKRSLLESQAQQLLTENKFLRRIICEFTEAYYNWQESIKIYEDLEEQECPDPDDKDHPYWAEKQKAWQARIEAERIYKISLKQLKLSVTLK